MSLTVDDFIAAFSSFLTGAGCPVLIDTSSVTVAPVLSAVDPNAEVQRPQSRAVCNVRIRTDFKELRDDAPVPNPGSDVQSRVATVILRIDNLAHEPA